MRSIMLSYAIADLILSVLGLMVVEGKVNDCGSIFLYMNANQIYA